MNHTILPVRETDTFLASSWSVLAEDFECYESSVVKCERQTTKSFVNRGEL